MRKFLLLALLGIMTIGTTCAQSGTTGNLAWVIANDTLTISGVGEMPNYFTTGFPSFTSAPWGVHRDSFAVVIVEDGVTTIGNNAFRGLSNLTSITIGNDVTTIGNSAFQNCTGLTSIDIPNSLTSIGLFAFSDCIGLTSITIPNSVTTIGNFAFQGCTGLVSVSIGSGLTSLNGFTFIFYPLLTSIIVDKDNPVFSSVDGVLFNKDQTTLIQYPRGRQGAYIIPNSVGTIGNNAFRSSTGLTSITIGSSVTTIGNGAFQNCTGLTSIDIPNSVTSIESFAFSDCIGLTSITIPNSVTTVGNFAFQGCTGLVSVSIGSGLTFLNGFTFNDYPLLTSIIVDKDNPAFSSVDGVLFNKDQTTLIRYPRGRQGAYIIPNSVGTIGNNAFRSCTGLTSVIIGDSVTNIGNGAFQDCTGLTSIDIPNSVTTIGNSAFSGCTGLTTITIGSNLVSIGNNAFQGCTALTTVYNFRTNPQTINTGTFSGVDLNNATLYVHAGIVFSYQSAAIWRDFGNIRAISTASGTAGNLTWYIANDTLTISGTGAMPNYALALVGLTTAPWSIHRSSFAVAVVEDGVTSIGNSAFRNCVGLTSVIIPNSVITIGNNVFSASTDLVSVYNFRTIPQTINAGTFSGVDLSSATLFVPGYFISVYKNAAVWRDFGSIMPIPTVSGTAGNLTWHIANDTLTISGTGEMPHYLTTGDGVTAAPWGIHRGSFAVVVVEDGVTSIGNNAFRNCVGLISVIIPNSVNRIGNNAFSGCTDLIAIINYALTPPFLGNEVFLEVETNSVSLYVPTQSVELYRQTPVWQDFLIKAMEEDETSVNETQTAQIFIFPNPVADSFQINGIEENTLVTISDMNGRIVFQRVVAPNEIIPTGHLSAGVYFVNAGGETMKIIKSGL